MGGFADYCLTYVPAHAIFGTCPDNVSVRNNVYRRTLCDDTNIPGAAMEVQGTP